MTTDSVRRRVEFFGFGLLELARQDARRFIVFEPSHGLFIRGDHESPLTLEDVSRFITPYESDPFTVEPTP